MKKEFINLDFVVVAGRKIKFISIMLIKSLNLIKTQLNKLS